MKILILSVLILFSVVLSGCGTTNNYYTDPADPRNNPGYSCTEMTQTTGGTLANTQLATTPAPMTMPQATQIVTTYEEVYATEYTPNGPVIKKQLIPIKSTVPLVEQPMLMNAPTGYGAVYNSNIAPSPYIKPIPVVIGTPPAQPVVPALNQPVAWFGPTAAPNYSTQTNWF